jgi:hypothetical protein
LQRPGQPEQAKQKRKRSPSVARPAFIIMQLLGDDGQPMQFDKRRVKVVAVERSAERVLEAVESGEHVNAFYLRVVVPAGSRAGSPNRPKDAPAAA